MCIKIVKDLQEVPYDSSKPLEEQVDGSETIVIKFEPKDKSIPVFMEELSKMAKNGMSGNLNFEVAHNDQLKGAKVKKQVNKLKNDIRVNEIIKAFVLNHKEADKKLEELISYCTGVGCNE